MSIDAWIFGGASAIVLGSICILRPRIEERSWRFVVALFGALMAGASVALLPAQAVRGGAAFLLVFVLVLRYLGRPGVDDRPRNGGGGDGNLPDLLLSVMKHLSSEPGDAHREVGMLRGQLAAAIRRAEEGDKRGEPEAKAAVADLRETGDTASLLKLLLAMRETSPADVLELDLEIAAVAYLRGEIETV